MLELIERKAEGQEIAIQPEGRGAAKVPDLMAALEASLAAVKDPEAGGSPTARSRREDGQGEGKKSSSSRAKAGAKK